MAFSKINASVPKYVRIIFEKTTICRILNAKNGAPERNNLEPFDSDQLLSELENWADILKAEPEVIHRLAVLAETQDEDIGDAPIVVPSPPELGL